MDWEWMTDIHQALVIFKEWWMVEAALPVYFSLPIEGICCFDGLDRLVGNWVWDPRHEQVIPVPRMPLQ